MSVSAKVRAVLKISGKRVIDLAEYFGMTKQTMNNKLSRGSWSAADLVKVAEFCGCKLQFQMQDGSSIILDEEKEKAPDAE